MAPSSESVTLPRGFRFHYQDGERPKTPEPPSRAQLQPLSPPRGPRLRVKRRNVSQVSGPTEQFLASVAAADVPLPTIEIPQTAEDVDMIDPFATSHLALGFLAPQSSYNDRASPRTPAPQLVASTDEVSSQRRAWYMTTPDDGMARPSSSLSNPSDWSDDSYFSGGRISRPSEDSTCTSPDDDLVDPFITFSKGKGKEASIENNSTSPRSNVLNGQLRSKTRNDAPWSKEMSEHLWQTYQVYLQDPTVTPFRIGASAVPPEGVIHRVAREAKRSWKGPKADAGRPLERRRVLTLTNDSSMVSEGASSPDTTTTSKSGSITPTGEAVPKVYIQWQHSSAATRNHLRELCKRKDSLSVQKHRHLQSRSPTPFSQSRMWSRDRLRSVTPPAQRVFSTKEIAISLASSSSISMQPNGPLAKLSEPSGPSNEPLQSENIKQDGEPGLSSSIYVDTELPSRRLRSPFSSRTYGPSASSNFFSTFTGTSTQDNLSVSGPRLRSPLRFNQARSLNGTQKRRARHALEEELSPGGAVVLPSIPDNQLFSGSLENGHRRVRIRGFSLGDAASRNGISGLFREHTDGSPSLLTQDNTMTNSPTPPRQVTPLLPSVEFSQSRLGSPFSEVGMSNTFPRRLFPQIDGNSTVRKRPFATVHHTRHSLESLDFGEGPSGPSRLSQVEEKLAEIRQRESSASKPSEENAYCN